MKHPTLSKIILTAFLILTAGAASVRAADGTWTNLAGGNWSDVNNWLNGTVADAYGDVASFNTLDVVTNVTILNPITVNLDDAARTNSSLVFSDADTNTPASWLLAGVGLTAPTNLTVTVSNLAPGQVTTISAPIADILDASSVAVPSTLTKLGDGVLVLSGANNFSGGTIVSNGTVRVGANTALGAGSAPVTLSGGTLDLTATITLTTRPIILGSKDSKINGTVNMTISGPITSAGNGTLYRSAGAATANSLISSKADNATVPQTFTNPIVVLNGSLKNGINGALAPFGTGTITISNPVTGGGSTVTHFLGNTSGNNQFWSNNVVIPTGFELDLDSVGSVGGATVGLGLFGNFSGGGTIAKTGGGLVTFGGDNSGFTGTVNGTSANASILFSSPNAGSANATWNFSSAAAVNPQARLGAAGGIIRFGQLAGIVLFNKNTDAGNVVFEIGGKNTDSAYSGIIGASASGGTLGINKVGTGLLTLSGANTYNGPTTLSNGVLVVDTESRLGANPVAFTANQLTLDGGAFSNTVSMVISNSNRGITLGTGSGLGGKFNVASGTILSISNVITGGGSLSLNTGGTLLLSAINTYTGKTILNAGTLVIGDETGFGGNPGGFTADQLTLNGGTLSNAVALTIDDANRGVTLGAAGGTINTSGGTLTIANAIAGSSGALTKAGSGILSLTSANSYSASTLINSGTLALGASGSIANSALISVAGGATFDVSAVSGFTLASGQTLGGNGTVSGNVAVAAGSTVNAGSSIGQINITGNVTFNVGTNLVEINSSTNDVVAITGNLTLTGTSTILFNVQSGLSSGRRVVMRYTGSLGGGGSFALANAPAGTTLDTSVAHEVAIVLNIVTANLTWLGDGTLNKWDSVTANWSNGVTAVLFNGGDNVTFNNNGSQSPAVNIVSAVTPNNVTVNATGNYTFSGAGNISGVANLTKTNSGTLTLLTPNNYSGVTLLSQGLVLVGNGTTGGSLGTGNITNNTSLTFNLPGSLTNSGAIFGSGSLTLQAGSVALAGDGDFSGSTTINSGTTLQIGIGGGTGRLGGGSVLDNGVLVYKRSGTVTNNSTIGGGGSLAVQGGGGTVILTGNNNYGGSTTVSNGTLQLGAGGISGTLGTAGTVTLTNNGALAFSRSDSVTNAVQMLGNGTLIQNGPGTVTLTATNIYGQTIINAGTLRVGDGVQTNGTLGSGNVLDNGTLVLNRPDNMALANTVNGSGVLVLKGNNTVTISQANGYGGGTIISNATLAFGNKTANLNGIGTGPVTIYNGTLAFFNNAVPFDGSSQTAFTNTIVVPAGQTASILESSGMRDPVTGFPVGWSGPVSGGGTINLAVNGVRSDVSGDWSGFSGVLNVTPYTVGIQNLQLINTKYGSAQINLNSSVLLQVPSNDGAANTRVNIGALSGNLGSQIGGGQNTFWVVGGANATNTFSGTIPNGAAATVNFVKVGTGKWILTEVLNYTGTTTVSNGVLALSTNLVAGGDASIASSSTITVASPGVLDATALAQTPGELQLYSTLAGNGTVLGGIQDNGNIAPGFSTNIYGNLTVSSNVVVNNTVTMKIDRNGTLFHDELTAPVITVNGGNLVVTQVGTNDLQTGDTFKLFSVAVSGAGFGSFNLPAQNQDASITYGWDTSKLAIDGTIVLTNGAAVAVNTSPTNIITQVQGNQLILSWPADHTGWGLQVQTNSLNVGLTTNWFDVSGATLVNSTTNTINPASGSTFYRLIYPPNIP